MRLLLVLIFIANFLPESKSQDTTPMPDAAGQTTGSSGDENMTTEEMTTTTSTTLPPPKNLCIGVKHRPEFSYTCCKGEMYPAGVNLDTKFKDCYEPPKGLESGVHDTLWTFYTCLADGIFQDSTTLVNFATKYTENYPQDIRDEILQKAAATESKILADSTAMMRERAVRHYYHHIERQVCEGHEEEDPENVLTECKTNQDHYREEMHARGGCCHGKPTPLPIEFLRRPPTEAIRECASGIMYSILPWYNRTYYLGLEFQDSDAQQLCQTACSLTMLGLTDESIDSQNTFGKPQREWTPKQVEDGMEIYNFDPAHVFDILTRVFSQEWRKSLNVQFLPAWNFTREVEESVAPLATRLWETEYGRSVEYAQVEQIFTMCESYNIIVRQLESVLYDDCNKDSM